MKALGWEVEITPNISIEDGIDSLMMIDVPQDGPDAITKQNEAVQKLASFKKTHNVHVHLVAHPRKLRDETEAPGKMEVAGASSTAQTTCSRSGVPRRAKRPQIRTTRRLSPSGRNNRGASTQS